MQKATILLGYSNYKLDGASATQVGQTFHGRVGQPAHAVKERVVPIAVISFALQITNFGKVFICPQTNQPSRKKG